VRPGFSRHCRMWIARRRATNPLLDLKGPRLLAGPFAALGVTGWRGRYSRPSARAEKYHGAQPRDAHSICAVPALCRAL
jgi:hypothetical protein